MQINNNGIVSISNSNKYLIQKLPIYPEGAFAFGDVILRNAQPIGYKIILKENEQKKAEKQEVYK